jgi:isoquinoline 1-oxidoreductase beta subunit
MNAPVKDFSPTRRALVVTSIAVTGGALLVGCKPADLLSVGAAKEDFGAFGPFIRVDPDGWVTVVNKHIEVGQGTHAGLAAIVAEEMDADWDKVKIVQAPANTKVYANLGFGFQGTCGSPAPRPGQCSCRPPQRG